MDGKSAEKLFTEQAKNGTYLVHDALGDPRYVYGLSVKVNDTVVHAGIRYQARSRNAIRRKKHYNNENQCLGSTYWSLG